MYFAPSAVAILIVRNQNKQLLSLWKQQLEKKKSTKQCRTVSADTTALKAKRFDEAASVNELRAYTGIVDLSCVTKQQYKELKSKLAKEFEKEEIKYKEDKDSVFNCNRKGVNFEVEIMRLNCFQYIRLKRLLGDKSEYNAIIRKLLGSIVY